MTKTSNLDRIIASVPANAQTARVMSRGEHYERARKPLEGGRLDVRASLNPLPINLHKQACHPRTPEIVGKQFGRWRVLGYSAQQPRSKNSSTQWVVKCSCGRYETRRYGSIIKAAETKDCCWECKTREHDVRRYRELGSAPLANFTGGKL